MTRGELIARMPSSELSAWWALFAVQEEEAQYARDVAESGDGVVMVYGNTDHDDEDGEDEGDDAEAE
jgi:hypothetical protein